MFIVIAIIGIIQGFIFASNGNDATALLLFSFLAFIVFGGLFFCALPIGRSYVKKIFENKNSRNDIIKQPHKTEEKLFCRKCGARILLDSIYCDKCGEKVETI